MKFWSTFQIFRDARIDSQIYAPENSSSNEPFLDFLYIPIDFDILLQISPTHFDFMPPICEASRAAEGTSTKFPCQELGTQRFLMKSP